MRFPVADDFAPLARMPAGVGLMLTGSGIYWVLSSQLIASFSVLAPGLFQSSSQGVLLILAVGVASIVAGLWLAPLDLNRMQDLLNRGQGWLLTLPVILPSADICLTLYGLSTPQGPIELNPVVASSIEGGARILLPFMISYTLLSAGLGLATLNIGQGFLPRSRRLAPIPFSLACASAAFGPFSNLTLISFSQVGLFSIAIGTICSAGLSVFVGANMRRLLL